MHIADSYTRKSWLALVALVGLTAFATPSHGSPLPIIDPTLQASTGPLPGETIQATPALWDFSAALLLTLYPDVDYASLNILLDMNYGIVAPEDYNPPWAPLLPTGPGF